MSFARRKKHINNTHAEENSTDHDNLEYRASKPMDGIGNLFILNVLEFGHDDNVLCHGRKKAGELDNLAPSYRSAYL